MTGYTEPRRLFGTGAGGAPGLDLARELLKSSHEVIERGASRHLP